MLKIKTSLAYVLYLQRRFGAFLKAFLRYILYFLSTNTSSKGIFARITYIFVCKVEMPLIVFFFKFFDAREVIFRHSVLQKENYHPFLSDIDFSVVADLEEFKKFENYSKFLKKIFLNLGEMEFYTERELLLMQEAVDPRGNALWDKFYNIRKISWQSAKNTEQMDLYEKLKIKRSLDAVWVKLGCPPWELNGSKIFEEFFTNINSTPRKTQTYYSPFLEINLALNSTNSKNLAPLLFFETYEHLERITNFFPNSNWFPENGVDREIRKVIVIKELLISLNTKRQKGNSADQVLIEWINQLEVQLLRLK